MIHFSMRLPFAAAITAVMAAPVLAACPSAGDLATGIWVEFDDGSIAHFMSDGAGTVTETTTFDSDEQGTDFSVDTLGGVVETSFADVIDGETDPASVGTITYSQPIEGLVPVTPGTVFSAFSTTTYPDGTSDPTERFMLVAGEAGKIDIGLCRYTSIPVTHTYISEDGPYGLTYLFLPDLGVSLFQTYRDIPDGLPDTITARRISDFPL